MYWSKFTARTKQHRYVVPAHVRQIDSLAMVGPCGGYDYPWGGLVVAAGRARTRVVRKKHKNHPHAVSIMPPEHKYQGTRHRNNSPDQPSEDPPDCWRCGDSSPPRLPSILLKPDPPLCLQPPWCLRSLWVSDACPGRGYHESLVSRPVSVLLTLPCLAPEQLCRGGGRESRPCVNVVYQWPRYMFRPLPRIPLCVSTSAIGHM